MSRFSMRAYLPYTLGILALGLVGYLVFLNYSQTEQIDRLTADRNKYLAEANQTKNLLDTANTTINELESELEELRTDLEDLADDYRDEQNRNEDFEDQIRDLAGTLGDLDKLARTDEELLAKYSKVSFLNENYIPERLEEIDEDWVAPGRGDEYFLAPAYEHLDDLMERAERAGLDLKIVSAYRSFDEQGVIKGNFTEIFGEGANAFSADQGYSEHQLGTTVDFSTASINHQLVEGFENTEEFKWLEENAHRYGFILSYPPDNAFYIYEPWHWRFVGRDLASDLNRANDNFYDWDQREIDKYLLTIFD
jgi:D-alanyl-D-alanine carboxypeptidase